MSGYNLFTAALPCPHCGKVGSVSVEFRFSLFEFQKYEIGDRLEWGVKGDRYPRRRPLAGDFRGEGYAECPFCERDYWVTIDVRSDIIASVVVDHGKPGYIPVQDSW